MKEANENRIYLYLWKWQIFSMSLRIFFSVEMITCVLSEYPLMYPQKVLQGVPNLKRAPKICILNFLIVSQSDSQFIRYVLLGHAFVPSGLP